MLACRLHSDCRHGPQARLQVDFGPSCTANLSASCGGQNKKCECLGCDRVGRSEPPKENWQVLIRHRRVVPPGQDRPGWQNALKVPTPTGWILATAPPMRCSKVHYPLNAPTKTRSGFWLAQPYGLKDRQNRLGVDHRNLSVANLPTIVRQRHLPLRSMLLIPPRAFHRAQELVGAFTERWLGRAGPLSERVASVCQGLSE